MKHNNTHELTFKESALLDLVLLTVADVLYGQDGYTDMEVYSDEVKRYVKTEKEGYLDDFEAFLSRLKMDLAVVRHAGEYRTKIILGERRLAEMQAAWRKAKEGQANEITTPKRDAAEDDIDDEAQEAAEHSESVAAAYDKDDCPDSPYECDYGCLYD